MARNLSQPQINRRKKVGAQLTRVTSGIGLAGLGVLGAGAAGKGLARTGKFARITEESATKFSDATQKKAAGTSVVAGGIGGFNGFNNASWQSAEARQRKKAIVKRNDSSPFEEGYYGEEGHPVEFEKALAPANTTKKPGVNGGLGGMKALRPTPKFKPMGQRPASPNVKAMRPVQLGQNSAGLSGVGKAFGNWKTIDQRERTQVRNRKTMRHAGAAAGVGAGAIGLAESNTPGATARGIKSVGNAAKHTYKLSRGPSFGETKPSSLMSGAKSAASSFKELGTAGKVGTAGAGVIAGAAAVGAGAKGMHTYQQHKINTRRRKNFGKSSAFGVEHY